MYQKDGESYFIVDAHIALWDARPENQRNIHGKQFIDCFYDYHRNLVPESEVWPYEDYLYQGGERLMKDLFEDGYVDHAIFQPALPARVLQHRLRTDRGGVRPRQAAPRQADVQPQLRPAQRRGRASTCSGPTPRSTASRASSSTPPSGTGSPAAGSSTTRGPTGTSRLCRELGITNIHVHKGPTIRPLDRDAFDVADIDHVATDFTDLSFIVEHVGLPRLEDFCWIATQEPNVHGGLAVAMPFIHTRPRYFAQIVGELLYWIGEDRIQFSSDYAIWTPRWLVERFVDFQIPEDLTEYAPITTAQKKKILGLNAAKMYDIAVPAELQLPDADETDDRPA